MSKVPPIPVEAYYPKTFVEQNEEVRRENATNAAFAEASKHFADAVDTLHRHGLTAEEIGEWLEAEIAENDRFGEIAIDEQMGVA